MGVVAISETDGSLGSEIGRALAQDLDYAFVDREAITRAAERFGEGVKQVAEKKPTFWERFTDTQYRYVTYIEATALELAARDNLVLVGPASAIVLLSVPYALRVRVIAPERLRVQRIEHHLGVTHAAAQRIVHDSDHEHAARVKFLHRVDWSNPLLYHLVFNTDGVTVDQAVHLIRETLGSEGFQVTPKSRVLVQDLSLGAQAKAALLANPMTRSREIHVSCSGATLLLSGSARSEEERMVAQHTVAQIPGAAGVQNNLVVSLSRTGLGRPVQ